MARLVSDIGGEPANRGEARVVRTLLEQLPDDYGVLPNIEVRERKGRLLEIDAIVTSPHAVYVVEIKDYSGAIEGDEREWRYRDRCQQSPIRLTNLKAKVVKSILQETDPDLRDAWVEALVALARKPQALRLTEAAGQHVFVLDRLVGFLTDPDALPRRPRAVADLAQRVEAVLAPVVRKRPGPRVFGSWKVVEAVGQDGDVAHYRAVNELAPKAPEKRLAVWTMSPYVLTEKQRRAERARVVREFTALKHMGPHPSVLGAEDAFEDGDAVVVVSEPPAGASLGLMLSEGLALSDDQRLAVLDELAGAVGHAHRSGVVHRRISPEVVFVDGERVQLGGFGHARVDAEGTIHHDPSTIDLDADGGYIAPEVMDADLGPVTAAADLFSLAAIAWTLWAGERLPGTWTTSGRSLDRPEGMPPGVWDVTATMLHPAPAERRATLAELHDAIARARSAAPGRPPAEDTAPPAPAEYAVGARIAGRYEVEEKLGAGTFSTVYRVRDTVTDARRALKVLDAKFGIDPALREARSLEDLRHPNVVQVLHVDRTPTTPPQWYIVTELAAGRPLTHAIDDHHRLSDAQAFGIAGQLLDACEHFHPPAPGPGATTGREGGGIVHRDIKPANVMYDPASGVVKLLDFNVASASGATVGTISGTPGYQPPDQDLDEWAADVDLFAVAVILYQLLTGDHPYPHRRPGAGPLRSLRSHRPDLPPALDRFFTRALSPRRRERFASATEMRAALRAAVPTVFGDGAEPGAATESRSESWSDAPTVVDPRDATTLVGAEAAGTSTAEDAVARESGADGGDDPGLADTDGDTDIRPAEAGVGRRRGHRRAAAGRRRARRRIAAGVAGVVLVTGAGGALVLWGGGGGPASGDADGSPDVPAAQQSAPEGDDCPDDFPVKGNESDGGELIYHRPGWRYYDQTKPEQCFATVEAAEEAGFRASKLQ